MLSSSSSLVDRSPVLSLETIRALKHYKHEVATYTLRQWNNAKIESERKERDRRRRRADLLAQRAATAAADTKAGSTGTPSATANQRHHAVRRTSNSPSDPRRAVGPSSATAHPSVAGASLGKQPRTRTSSGNENGPLMMVSRRRSERRTNPAPSSSYGVSSAHLAGPAPVPPHNSRHHTTAPVILSAMSKQPQHPASEPHRSRHQRHKSHSPARHGAFDQTSNLSYAFDRPTIHHLESVIASLDLNDSYHASSSASTPPILIPARAKEEEEDSFVQSVPSNVSSPSSSSSRKCPARVLGFTAHLGMTSIADDATAKDAVCSSSMGLSDSASTSNPTSEGSSRMSSFSETNHTLHSVRMALKDATDDTPVAENLDAWPIRMYGEGIEIQGDEEHVFGPMEHH